MAEIFRGTVIDEVAKVCGSDAKTVKAVLDDYEEVIWNHLVDGDKVHIKLGTLSARETPARMAHDPHTMEQISVPAHNAVHFKPAGALKEAVRAPK